MHGAQLTPGGLGCFSLAVAQSRGSWLLLEVSPPALLDSLSKATLGMWQGGLSRLVVREPRASGIWVLPRTLFTVGVPGAQDTLCQTAEGSAHTVPGNQNMLCSPVGNRAPGGQDRKDAQAA